MTGVRSVEWDSRGEGYADKHLSLLLTHCTENTIGIALYLLTL